MSSITFNNKAQIGKETSLFISKWDTTQAGSANDTIILPFVADGDYDFYVDWGDGTRDNITTYNQAEVTHQYSNTGIYEVRIYGSITGWQFNNAGDDDKIIEISQWGPLGFVSNDSNLFYGCSNLELTATDSLTLGASNGQSMFNSCPNLGSGGYINNWDTSSLITMYRMFYNNTTFNMDVSNWDVSSCTNFNEMFYNADSFNQDIGGWTFATGLDKDITCFRMFQNDDAFNNGGSPSISGWNTSRVNNMRQMFQQSAFNQPIGTWDTSNVTNMQQMFNSATIFNQDIGDWETSGVTTMSSMFNSATSFNNGGSTGINNWNTSNVTIMSSMFANADSFNQPIGNWDVSSCTAFIKFLENQAVFDQDLSNWQLYTGLGDTIDMNSMFRNCPFNNSGQPGISGWNTSRVDIMNQMFDGNSAFNQPIGSLDTSSVTNMNRMFEGSSAFDQDLSNWIVTGVTVFGSTFMSNVTLSTENYDRTLSGWAQQSGDLQTGLQISFGNSQYSVATGQQYRDILTGVGWTITDGGAV